MLKNDDRVIICNHCPYKHIFVQQFIFISNPTCKIGSMIVLQMFYFEVLRSLERFEHVSRAAYVVACKFDLPRGFEGDRGIGNIWRQCLGRAFCVSCKINSRSKFNFDFSDMLIWLSMRSNSYGNFKCITIMTHLNGGSQWLTLSLKWIDLPAMYNMTCSLSKRLMKVKALLISVLDELHAFLWGKRYGSIHNLENMREKIVKHYEGTIVRTAIQDVFENKKGCRYSSEWFSNKT